MKQAELEVYCNREMDVCINARRQARGAKLHIIPSCLRGAVQERREHQEALEKYLGEIAVLPASHTPRVGQPRLFDMKVSYNVSPKPTWGQNSKRQHIQDMS